MAYIHQLIADIEHEQDAPRLGCDRSTLDKESAKIHRHVSSVPEDVLKFAPKKMRLQHAPTEGRVEQLETEIKQWQDRANQAEMRLRSIEKSIQEIAAKYIRPACDKNHAPLAL